MSRGFEALHGSFPLLCWLMGVLSSIVQTFVLAVLDAGHHLFLGGCIAGQLLGNNHARDILQSFEQLAKELSCCAFVAPTLDQDIEDITILVNGSP
jgi:hypothetical protein